MNIEEKIKMLVNEIGAISIECTEGTWKVIAYGSFGSGETLVTALDKARSNYMAVWGLPVGGSNWVDGTAKG